MVLISHYLEIVIIISFLAKSTFKLPFPRAMFAKCGIIAALMLKIYKKLFRILIGKMLLKIFLMIEAKAACCTEQIMKAKNDDAIRMTNNLNDSKAAPKYKDQY